MPTRTFPRLTRLSAIACALLVSACGPTSFTKVRATLAPVAGSSLRVTVDNVTMDATTPEPDPADLKGILQKCTSPDSLEYTSKGVPLLEEVSVAVNGQMWRRVSVTNRNANILRLNTMAVRLFTPDGREWPPLTRDQILKAFRAARPCPSSDTALSAFRDLRLLEKTAEIMPGATVTGWLAFQPPAPEKLPGEWKLGLYDVPVRLNETGRTTKAGYFEFRYNAVTYRDTYRKKHLLATPKLIESIRVD